MAKTPRPPKADQQHLPDMEPMPKNQKVHAAALRYAERRDERQAANKEETAAHDTLLEKMVEAGLESYKYGSVEVHIDASKKCKVKVANAQPSENGEGE